MSGEIPVKSRILRGCGEIPVKKLYNSAIFRGSLVGACWNLAQQIFHHGGPISGYLSGVEIGLVMCAVIWCMFNLVMWMVRKQEAKS
jgi:uncharacterized membrane protein YsdA (DUF1294 family)